MRISFIVALFCSVVPFYASAQQQTSLKGRVVNSITKEPVAGVTVLLRDHNISVHTGGDGVFEITGLSLEKDLLSLTSPSIFTKEIFVKIIDNTNNDIQDISVIPKQDQGESGIGILDEELLIEGEDGGAQNISSMVTISNDVYLGQARFQLSPFRFSPRGYSSVYEQKFINGVNFNDQNRGLFNYASIGALNDVTRNGDLINYNNPGSFTFGSIGGSENLNMRAGSYSKGGKLTASYTNRNYYMRGMASYATGLMDNGWAFMFAVGGRYSDEGNIEGTFYRNISYAFAVEKQFAKGEHSISLTTFGSPVVRGQQGASYQEAYDLVGNNYYNPNWGYQNGKKRNSRIVTAFDPTVILSHIWKISDETTLTSGIGYHYGRYGGSALNWYNGADPRPDYYRYMPSYYKDNEQVFNYYKRLWQTTCGKSPVSQVDWDNIYLTNEIARREGAIYMLEERRSDLSELSFNSVLNTELAGGINLTAGIGYKDTKSKQFKTVADLLGAEFLIDVDKFAERDFPGDNNIIQNDMNNPYRRVYKDDIFGYNFRLNIQNVNFWIQNYHRTSKLDFYYGTKLSYTDFYRDGLMQNGRYPDNSYGKGLNHTFIDYSFKAGFSYKISGRQFITANFLYATNAPLPNDSYLSPRISDITVDNLKSNKILSADLSYIFSFPQIQGRVSLFYTGFYDKMLRTSYYHDIQRTFVNHLITGVNTKHKGVELGVKYKINDNLSLDFAGTISEYYYSNNPKGIISVENGKFPDKAERVYLNNYYIGGVPQMAGSIGINYFYNFWFIDLTVNGVDRTYIDIAPSRRLSSNYDGINPLDPKSMEVYRTLTNQERFRGGATVDFSIGKILYLPNRHSLNFNLSFFNILNNRSIQTGGYEQARLDMANATKFASKYFYMPGFNCFLNISYKF